MENYKIFNKELYFEGKRVSDAACDIFRAVREQVDANRLLLKELVARRQKTVKRHNEAMDYINTQINVHEQEDRRLLEFCNSLESHGFCDISTIKRDILTCCTREVPVHKNNCRNKGRSENGNNI